MKNHENIEFQYDVTEMFSADDTWTYAREPVFRRMPDGSLYALIYTGGNREPHPDNLVAGIRSTDNGKTWSKPEIVFKHPYYCSWATELFTAGPRPFCIFQTFDFRTGYCGLRAYMSYTDDSGKTWSDPISVPGVPANFTARQGKILSDGSWIFPVYWEESHGGWDTEIPLQGPYHDPRWLFVSGMIRSVDQGKSFQIYGNVTCEGKFQAWEPDITELDPGHLQMLIRSECPERVLWISESFDYGKTWTEARRSDIPNPATKQMILDVKGCKLLFNNVCPRDKPDRNQLELWISEDNCKTWKKKIRLATLHRKGEGSCWDGFFTDHAPLPQVAYPHAFADEKEQTIYLAIDSVRKFFLMKIPYADIF